MKPLCVIILLALSAVLCMGQVPETDFAWTMARSISSSDGMLAPLVNPAAIGFGNSGGVGFTGSWSDKEFNDHYWFYQTANGFSYIYEKAFDKGNDHTVSTGFELTGPYVIPNLYVGTSYQWHNSEFTYPSVRSGVLYRPLTAFSFAFVLNNPYRCSPYYTMGFGWRPFANIPLLREHRLELTADAYYTKNEVDTITKSYELLKPLLGLETELLDGLKIGGAYNLENESVNLTFGLNLSKLHLAANNRNYESNNNNVINNTFFHLFIPEKSFLTFFETPGRDWYSMHTGKEVVTNKVPRYRIGPFRIFDKEQTGVETILSNIAQAADNETVYGIIFKNQSFSSSLALKQEIISALKEFKAKGKKIIFYYDNMSNADYIFAAAVADEIYLNPHGIIDLKGIAITSPYLRDALSALGIEVMNFRSHPTKTGFNTLSESEMTSEEKAEYDKVIDSMYRQMLDLVQEGRGNKLSKPLNDIIDDGPYYMSEDALAAGLVDDLVYEAGLTDILKDKYRKARMTSNLPEYQNYSWSHPRKTKVAIIYAQGNIVMGRDDSGKTIAHDTYVALIRKVRKDKQYKGIILRVDSGGGSAQASDIIYKEIELAKSENKKPVIVSMTGVAGSGGYYIASNADLIYADPGTLTGAIGVLSLAFNAEKLFDKIKVNWSTVKRGKHADFGMVTRKWTDDEKSIMSRLVASSYADFTSKVARGRNMEMEAVDRVAQGKIWTGEQAKQIGLVDELGGLQIACSRMKQLANIKGDMELVNVSHTGGEFVFSIETSASIDKIFPEHRIPVLKNYIDLYDQWSDLFNEHILYMSDYDLDALSVQ